MLADPSLDLIVVATPNDSHATGAKRAIEAGRHVLVEKPFALSRAEAHRILKLAEQRGVIVSAFQNRRFDTDFLTVRQVVESGKLGAIRHFECQYIRYSPDVQPRWKVPAAAGAGLWLDTGPHLVDQIVQLFGLPQAVVADFAAMRPGGGADDWTHVVLHYQGMRVALHCSMLVVGGTPGFMVHGEEATLLKRRSDPQGAQLLGGMIPGGRELGHRSR